MEENGILHISKTKKGRYNGELEINGKKQPAGCTFKNDALDGKECIVIRRNGLIEKLTAGNEVLIDKTASFETLHNGAKVFAIVPHTEGKTCYKDSFDIKKTCLPSDTREIDIKQIENFYLKFHKAARYEKNENRKDPFLFVNFSAKDDADKYNVIPCFDGIDFSRLSKMQMRAVGNLGHEYVSKKYATVGNLVSGIGSQSVYKVSMLLHFIYGFPYLTGQSIKGIVRSWMISECFENEDDAFKDNGFCRIFGSIKDKWVLGEHRGMINFYDAYPISKPNIGFDIMNPHYSYYYSDNNNPPADYYNPVPINFMVINDTTFNFIIGTGCDGNIVIDDGKFKGKYILDVACEWLGRALTGHGIGSKTAVGYGYMQPSE